MVSDKRLPFSIAKTEDPTIVMPAEFGNRHQNSPVVLSVDNAPAMKFVDAYLPTLAARGENRNEHRIEHLLYRRAFE